MSTPVPTLRTGVQNPGMQRVVPVPPDLAPWLEAAVVVDTPAGLAQSHFPAMVSSMLVVRLAGRVVCRGTAVPPSAWISASTTATVYEHGGPVRAVGLVLRPAAAAALWAGARGLVNTLRPMPELAGPGWAAVERAVRAAADDGARLVLLCRFIRQLAAPPAPCEARRQEALALLQAARTEAAGAAGPRKGLSTRQLERRFATHWGMSPKQFQVIARLNGALGQALAMEHGPGGQGAALAVDQGYYDQSHLARDVRRLAGRPLQALVLGARTPLTAHWPLQIGAQAQDAPTAQPREPGPGQGASRKR
jgi:methylphosphotriester-DNA--protein-cysteine methyltransferase